MLLNIPLIRIYNCLVKFCIDLYFYRHIPGGQYPISPASTDSFAKLQYLFKYFKYSFKFQ